MPFSPGTPFTPYIISMYVIKSADFGIPYNGGYCPNASSMLGYSPSFDPVR